MDKKPKLLKRNYIQFNKNQINTRPKTTKERIQDLINQNEDNIKKYEKLRIQTLNPRKKAEYEQIIAKYRSQQVKLHNKLYSINLYLNVVMNKLNHNIPKPKPRFNLSNNLYLKQYFNNKVDSSIKQNFNYSNIFTNTASKQNINKKENIKCSSCINTLFDTKKNIITNSIKKINIINNQKKEVNNKNYNNNLYRIFLNTSTQTRPNNEYNHNSTLVTSSSSKYDNKAKNKYITPSINENNKLYHSKKNIFIINNINNFYNNHFNEKTKNNSTKSSDKNMKHLTYHIVNKNLKKEIKNKILKYNIIDQDKQLDINIKYNEEKKIIKKKMIFLMKI
jgi:hypothetical protein